MSLELEPSERGSSPSLEPLASGNGSSSRGHSSNFSQVDINRPEVVSIKRLLMTCSIGSFFEYYDYALIIFFQDQIEEAFFPNSGGDEVTLLDTWSLFGIAYVMRPIGGILFGYIADRYGRRRALIISILSMGIPTFLFGCIPDYNTIGYAAPILAFLCRAAQGVAVSGEYGNSAIYVYEQAATDITSTMQGVLWLGSTGSLLVALVKFAISHTVSDESLYSWVWRIPFWCGILICGLGFGLRLLIPEAEIYQYLRERDLLEDNPTKTLLTNMRHYWKPIVVLTLLFLSPGFIHSIVFWWLPDYLDSALHNPDFGGTWYVLFACFGLGLPTLVWVGVWSDAIGEYKTLTFLYPFVIMAAPIMFTAIGYTSNTVALAFEQVGLVMISVTVIAPTMAVAIQYVTDARLRSSFISFPYNLASAITNGFGGEAMTALVGIGNYLGPFLAGLFFAAILAINAVGIWWAHGHPFEPMDKYWTQIEKHGHTAHFKHWSPLFKPQTVDATDTVPETSLDGSYQQSIGGDKDSSDGDDNVRLLA